MDDDDLSLPTRLEKEVRVLENNPNIAVVGSWQKHFGTSNWVHQPPETCEEMKATLLFECCVCHSTIMFKKIFLFRIIISMIRNFIQKIMSCGQELFKNMTCIQFPKY